MVWKLSHVPLMLKHRFLHFSRTNLLLEHPLGRCPGNRPHCISIRSISISHSATFKVAGERGIMGRKEDTREREEERGGDGGGSQSSPSRPSGTTPVRACARAFVNKAETVIGHGRGLASRAAVTMLESRISARTREGRRSNVTTRKRPRFFIGRWSRREKKNQLKTTACVRFSSQLLYEPNYRRKRGRHCCKKRLLHCTECYFSQSRQVSVQFVLLVHGFGLFLFFLDIAGVGKCTACSSLTDCRHKKR